MTIHFPNSTSPGSQVDTQLVRTSRNDGSPQGVGNTGSQPLNGNSEVSLSDTNVSALRTQLANLPSIRQERVLALQQAVHSGNYPVDGRQLADAIQADLFGPNNSGS